MAAAADLGRLRRVLHRDGKEQYAPDWSSLTLGEQVASTQWSIMVELLLRVHARCWRRWCPVPRTPVNFVLTGSLSQSEFFQQVFQAGVQLLAPSAQGPDQRPARDRYATRRRPTGQVLNAMRPEDPHAATQLCPTRSAKQATKGASDHLKYLLHRRAVDAFWILAGR